jgi:hypothetical protein
MIKKNILNNENIQQLLLQEKSNGFVNHCVEACSGDEKVNLDILLIFLCQKCEKW